MTDWDNLLAKLTELVLADREFHDALVEYIKARTESEIVRTEERKTQLLIKRSKVSKV